MFSARGELVFTKGQNLLKEAFYKKNFPVDDQTWRAKSSTRLVNWPGVQPLTKSLL